MAPLNRGLELLESAVRFALADAARVTPQLLSRSTPCPGWDLETLLEHLCDSIAVLHEAIDTAGVGAGAPAGHPRPGHDPVSRLRGQQPACSPSAPLPDRPSAWSTSGTAS